MDEQKRYIFSDGKSNAELTRLATQEHHLARTWGLLPSSLQNPPVLETMHRILDLACGTGGWLLDLTTKLKDHVELAIGIDHDPAMVNYARAQARARNLQDYIAFQQADVLQRLPFEDHSFDLVNARLIGSFMPPNQWPIFLQECQRVVRPGGWVVLTESENIMVNGSVAPATERLTKVFLHALCATQKAFGNLGMYWGVTTMLLAHLRHTGFQNIQQEAFCIELSHGQEGYASAYEDIRIGAFTAKPFLIQYGGISADEFEQIYAQALEEMKQPQFSGVTYSLRAWGQKQTGSR